MKNFFLLSLLLSFALVSCAQKKENSVDTTTYYLIRHAEKDRSDKTNRDPNLSEEGKQRAELWASYFENIDFDAIYSTDYNRTRETARPTAEANELNLVFYDPFKIDFEEFLTKTKGKTVLIVGHSNTTPMLTNRILGEEKYEAMDETDNISLFKVTLTEDSKTSELLKID
ncbi:phosphoglycerate mutase family protein [Winogradskyella ouciana]|uniref:Phosphoglycerate mutase n=1 Tax=Winogradskyella ouciana TaxID=2608631 RepID=A0A7K1GBS0_9FLAO|nr:phosphoglycerate mutase family protein [Winogradskyella ouciana]MTE25369.1 phosphoglycerate mutase [Winogradskyella ouciana]